MRSARRLAAVRHPCTAASPLVRSLAAGGPAATASGNAQNVGSTVLWVSREDLRVLQDGGGSIGGHLFVTTAGATASGTTVWNGCGAGSGDERMSRTGRFFNPFGFDVSSVTVDPHDVTGATVYATVMGFGSVLSSVASCVSLSGFRCALVEREREPSRRSHKRAGRRSERREHRVRRDRHRRVCHEPDRQPVRRRTAGAFSGQHCRMRQLSRWPPSRIC